MVKGEQFEFPIPEDLNLGSYFLDDNLAPGRAERPAIYYEGGTLSFLDLWHLTGRMGNVLRHVGVEPENRILLINEDSPEWVAAWLAAMKIGAVGTHAYTYLPAHDYTHFLNLVRPKAVIVDGSTLARVREAAQGQRYPKALLVAGETGAKLQGGEFSLPDLLAQADDTLEMEPTHRDDTAFWNFSGGTTGKPKGVPHMHRDALINFESFNSFLPYGADDIVLRVPKLFFHYSRDNGLMFALKNGAASILSAERSTAALMFELIDKYRPTKALNVPTMMRAMLETPEDERADLSCLKRSYSSGEVLSPQLLEDWDKAFGGEVIDRIGSAESGTGYLTNRPGAVVPGSSGTVTPLAEVKLVDEDGNEVEQGQPGEMMVRSDAAAQSYVREHDKSLASFPGDEWFKTGDLFTQDVNGYFWFVGRANDMVKVSGVWVAPLEIEQGLQDSANVLECAAMSAKDADGLLSIKAYVVLRDGLEASPDMAEKLQRYCKDNLASYKYPASIQFMEELPKTGQGKFDRFRLRQLEDS